jgi:hypothetical protein
MNPYGMFACKYFSSFYNATIISTRLRKNDLQQLRICGSDACSVGVQYSISYHVSQLSFKNPTFVIPSESCVCRSLCACRLSVIFSFYFLCVFICPDLYYLTTLSFILGFSRARAFHPHYKSP